MSELQHPLSQTTFLGGNGSEDSVMMIFQLTVAYNTEARSLTEEGRNSAFFTIKIHPS